MPRSSEIPDSKLTPCSSRSFSWSKYSFAAADIAKTSRGPIGLIRAIRPVYARLSILSDRLSDRSTALIPIVRKVLSEFPAEMKINNRQSFGALSQPHILRSPIRYHRPSPMFTNINVSDTSATIHLGGKEITARLNAGTKILPGECMAGECMDIAFDLSKASDFVPDTGERLNWGFRSLTLGVI